MGQDVIPSYLNFITQTRSIENEGFCDKVQIITHNYGAAEVLVTLSDFPTNSSTYISNVINLAPCAIITSLSEDTDSKKNSKEHHSLENNNYYKRTKRFCDFYPSLC